MSDILVEESFYISTSDACVIDLTPPTFAGINFLDVESRGQIRSGWSPGTDVNVPIRYEVYIQESTATGLFNVANIVGITPQTQLDIFTMPDGSFLQNGTTYYVGVRAVDALGNRDANTISLNVISTGVLTSIDLYESNGSFSIADDATFNLTVWADKNGVLANSPSAILGTASYEIYDSMGALVSGMSGSGVSATAAGLFIFPSVTNTLDLLNEHYQIRTSVIVDGEARVNYTPIISFEKKYKLDGTADFNDAGQIVGSFWISRNEKVLTTGLGLGSFTVYTADGILLPLSGSGITADANGFYVISPITPPFPLDPTKAFIIKLVAEADGAFQDANIVLGNEPEVFDCKAVFSINALNQLQASFWATKTNAQLSGAILGTASYQIYDRNGNAVSGLTQSGMTADGNGYYHSTPVSAALLTDLTHFLTKFTIVVAGQPRTVTKGFTLLGT
jgi:hypothetical protein